MAFNLDNVGQADINYYVTELVIANGTAVSAALPMGATRICAIIVPATWTTANLTFQASDDGVTYYNVYDIFGSELTATAAASYYILLDPKLFACTRFLKIRSGTNGTPVNQGADRTLKVLTRII